MSSNNNNNNNDPQQQQQQRNFGLFSLIRTSKPPPQNGNNNTNNNNNTTSHQQQQQQQQGKYSAQPSSNFINSVWGGFTSKTSSAPAAASGSSTTMNNNNTSNNGNTNTSNTTNNTNSTNNNSNNNNNNNNNSNDLEAKLSRLQQNLPDNHPQQLMTRNTLSFTKLRSSNINKTFVPPSQQQQQQQQPQNNSSARYSTTLPTMGGQTSNNRLNMALHASVSNNTSSSSHHQTGNNNNNNNQQYVETTLFSSNPLICKSAWKEIFGQACDTAADCERPPDDPLTEVKKTLKLELEVHTANILTRRRTALLRKRSLADYEKALQDVSNDEGAQKALQLWKILDETSTTVNSNLQNIRDRFEREHEGDDDDDDDSDENDADEDEVPLYQQHLENASLTKQLKKRKQEQQATTAITNNQVEKIAQSASRGEISIEDALKIIKNSHPREFVGNLLPFQEESLAFFLNLNSRGANGILADEMGLGKTCQSIAIMIAARQLKRLELILQMRRAEIVEKRKMQQQNPSAAARMNFSSFQDLMQRADEQLLPCLVVAPLSTSSSWAQEFQTFAPSLRVGIYGCVDDRAAMLAQFFGEKSKVAAKAPQRRARRKDDEPSSSSEDEDDESGSDDDEEDDDTSSGYSESTDSSDRRRRWKNKMKNAARSGGGGRGRGGAGARGGRGGARGGRGNNNSSAAAAAAKKKKKFGFDILVLPHHFFSQLHSALSQRFMAKLCKTHWFYIVIDEAHRIKNDAAVLTTTLQQFRNVDHRLVLTGTPLQNSLDELWTLLSFLLPDVFAKGQFITLFKAIADLHSIPSLSAATLNPNSSSNKSKNNKNNKNSKTNNTNKPLDKAAAAIAAMEQERARASAEERQFLLCRKIHDVLLPLMVRREKKDVIKELPKLSEWYVVCPNASLQQFEADVFLKKNAESAVAISDAKKEGVAAEYKKRPTEPDDNNDENENSDDPNKLSIFCERRLALHPFMLRVPRDVKRSLCDEEVQQHLFKASGKFIILDLFLRFAKKFNQRVLARKEKNNSNNNNDQQQSSGFTHQHKVLIFSQFSSLLELVETHVGWCRGWPYLKLDGSTGDRPALLNEFKTNDDQFIFLLTKGAGGVGLNLQSADTVILLDIDYNPTMDTQSIARAYRVGQRKDVLVLKLISDFAAEKSVMELASRKQDLENKVILAGKFDTKAHDDDRDEALRKMVEKKEKQNQRQQQRANNENDDDDANHMMRKDKDGNNNSDLDGNDSDEEADGALNVINSANQPYQVSRMKINNANRKKSTLTSAAATPSSNMMMNFPSQTQTKLQQMDQIRSSLRKEILRFFPRNDFERKFLEGLIDGKEIDDYGNEKDTNEKNEKTGNDDDHQDSAIESAEEEEDFLAEAVEALWINSNSLSLNSSTSIMKPDPNSCSIPSSLLLPEGTRWKSGAANLTADVQKIQKEELLVPRAAAVAAGKTLDERRRKIEAGEIEEDEDEDAF